MTQPLPLLPLVIVLDYSSNSIVSYIQLLTWVEAAATRELLAQWLLELRKDRLSAFLVWTLENDFVPVARDQHAKAVERSRRGR